MNNENTYLPVRDPVLASRILSAAQGALLAVRAYREVSSTMDIARSWVQEENEKLPGLVFALQQTQGRGRRGRSWECFNSGLYCTFISKPAVSVEKLAGLSLAVGVATIRMLEKIVPGFFTLKWPNDVLARDGRKLSGTLIEIVRDIEGDPCVLIGIGLNCAGVAPETISACALSEYSQQDIEPEHISGLLAAELLPVLADFYVNGFPYFKNEWLSFAAHTGKDVLVTDEKGAVTGRFLGLGDTGTLLLDTGEGQREIAVGDVAAL